MEEPVFITYANANLTENPEVFYQLFEYFSKRQQLPMPRLPGMFVLAEEIIKYFIQFVGTNGIESAREILKEESQMLTLGKMKELVERKIWKKTSKNNRDRVRNHWKTVSLDFAPEVRIGFEAVFGNRDNYCEEGPCPKFIERVFAFDRELLRGRDRLKCYECDQMMFKKMMEGLAKGVEYSKIPERFINDKYHATSYYNDREKHVKPGTKQDGKLIYWVHSRETLTRFLQYAPQNTMVRFLNSLPGEEKSFREFRVAGGLQRLIDELSDGIRQAKNGQPRVLARFFGLIFYQSFAAYSLAEFLIHNDRRKLKKCPYCEGFYIAKDIKRQRCYSKKCQREYERQRKQKQREDDPVKYY